MSAAPALAPNAAMRAAFLSATDAAGIVPAWEGLARRALEPNVFYLPGFVLPGMRHLPEERPGRLLAAWQGDRLVGLWPLLPGRGRHLNPFPMLRAALHYGTLSTPLLDAEAPEAALDALVDALARDGVRGLLLPFVAADGPVAAVLDRVAAARGLSRVVIEEHARAVLRTDLPAADYVRATLETRRRKEADRQRRRLAEGGTLAFTVVAQSEAIGPALEAFLELEARGWKGEAGTALLKAEGAADFIREAAAALAPDGAFRVATLTLDGRPVAAGLVVVHGPRAYFIKIAYDEDHARFSPGLLLTLDLTRHLLEDPAIRDADSIAVADHPMIDRVWTARERIVSLALSTRPGGGSLFRAGVAAERARHRARTAWRDWRQSRESERSRSPTLRDAANKAGETPAD